MRNQSSKIGIQPTHTNDDFWVLYKRDFNQQKLGVGHPHKSKLIGEWLLFSLFSWADFQHILFRKRASVCMYVCMHAM